jgi:hypothetical protein
VSVLIDPPRWNAHGRRWSHLVSDTSLDELHAFAAALGIPARGFEGDHYDVPEEHYAAAVAAGAHPVQARDLLRRLEASGLRRRKRAGEKVVFSAMTADGLRLDAVRSRLPPAAPVRRRHLALRNGDLVYAVTVGGIVRLPGADAAPSGIEVVQVGYARWVDGGHVSVAAEVLLHGESAAGAPAAGPAGGWHPVTRLADRLPPWTAALLGNLGMDGRS